MSEKIEAGSLTIDTTQMQKDVAEIRRLLKQVEDATKGTAANTKKSADAWEVLGAGIGGFIKGLALFGTTVMLLKRSLAEVEQWEKSTTRLNTALRATEGAAGIGASGLRQMAEELENTSLFDGNSVRDAQRVMMGFTTVQEETYRRAMRASADFAAQTGQDISGAAQTVGRALEMPQNAASMLRRANVYLTEAVKENIKELMAQGKTAEAQAIILDELEKKVGGAAAALAEQGLTGAASKAKKAMGDLLEGIGRTETVSGTAIFYLTKLKDLVASMAKPFKDLADARALLESTPEMEAEAYGIDLKKQIGEAEARLALFQRRAKQRGGGAFADAVEATTEELRVLRQQFEQNDAWLNNRARERKSPAQLAQDARDRAEADAKLLREKEEADAERRRQAEVQKAINQRVAALRAELIVLAEGAEAGRVYTNSLIGVETPTATRDDLEQMQSFVDGVKELNGAWEEGQEAAATYAGYMAEMAGIAKDTADALEDAREQLTLREMANSGNKELAREAQKLELLKRQRGERELLEAMGMSQDDLARFDAQNEIDVARRFLDENVAFMEELWRNAARNIQSNFAQTFSAVIQGQIRDFRTFVNSILTMFSNMLAQMAAAQMAQKVSGFIFDAIAGMRGGGAALPEGVTGGISKMAGGLGRPAGTSHTGGVIGVDGHRFTRSAFSRLAPDEYPTILQKGESVMTPAQMRAMGAMANGGGGGGREVVVHTPVTISVQAMDGPSVAAMLASQSGTIVGVVQKAVKRSRGVAESIGGR